MNDITLAFDVLHKIVSGMFLNGAGLFIVGLFVGCAAVFIFKAKNKC